MGPKRVMVAIDNREGALKRCLQAIRHGTPHEALEAAKSLGVTATLRKREVQCLEQWGTMSAMLKVPFATCCYL